MSSPLNAKSFIEKIYSTPGSDIDSLIEFAQGVEREWIEYKGYLFPYTDEEKKKNPKWEYQWNLNKAIISMRNSLTGGVICVGIGEENNKAVSLGLYDPKDIYKQGYDRFYSDCLLGIITKNKFGKKNQIEYEINRELSSCPVLHRKFEAKDIAIICIEPVPKGEEILVKNVKKNYSVLYYRNQGDGGRIDQLYDYGKIEEYKKNRNINNEFFNILDQRYSDWENEKKQEIKNKNVLKFDFEKYNKSLSNSKRRNNSKFIDIKIKVTQYQENDFCYEIFDESSIESLEKLKSETYLASEILKKKEKSDKFIIYGDGGSGKTTLLDYFYRNYINLNNILPIYIPLRDKSILIKENTFLKVCQKITKIDLEVLKRLLNQGKIVLFLDGLNEVKDENFESIQERFNNFVEEYENVIFFITTRFKELKFNTTFNVKYIKILPILSDESIKMFIDKYAQDKSNLFYKIKNTVIEEFRKTPLSIIMVIKTLVCNREIKSQTDLFRFVTFDLLSREIKKERWFNCEIQQIRNDLSFIASEMVNKNSFKEVINGKKPTPLKICQEALLGEFYEDDKTKLFFKFKHQKFRDYFAAEFFLSDPSSFIEIYSKNNLSVQDNIQPLVFAAELSENISSFLTQDIIFESSPELRESLLGSISHIDSIQALKKYITLDGREIKSLTVPFERKVRYAAALSLSRMYDDLALYTLIDLTKNSSTTTALIAISALNNSVHPNRKKIGEVLKQLRTSDINEIQNKVKKIELSKAEKASIKSLYSVHSVYVLNKKWVPADKHNLIKNVLMLSNKKVKDREIRDICMACLRDIGPPTNPAEKIGDLKEMYYDGSFSAEPYPGIINSPSFKKSIPCVGFPFANANANTKKIKTVEFSVKEITYKGITGYIIDTYKPL